MPQKILILAANPKNTKPLRLDQEMREIDIGLRQVKNCDQFLLEKKLAIRTDDLRLALLDEDPQYVHFCGHGEEEGILLEDLVGSSHLVKAKPLANLFKLFSKKIKCVVLNACYSEIQAKAICEHINYVIGMKKAIGDKAAIKFSTGFYQAIGAGRNIEDAFEFGKNAIELENIPGHLIPVLLTKSIADPEQLIEYIKEVQKQYVRESYGEMAHQCFTDKDFNDFIQAKIINEITQNLGQDDMFQDIIMAIKSISSNEQKKLLISASNTYKPTWEQLNRIDKSGQTDAGQRAEKMIAKAICNYVENLIDK